MLRVKGYQLEHVPISDGELAVSFKGQVIVRITLKFDSSSYEWLVNTWLCGRHLHFAEIPSVIQILGYFFSGIGTIKGDIIDKREIIPICCLFLHLFWLYRISRFIILLIFWK
jgi:hypothetical protein